MAHIDYSVYPAYPINTLGAFSALRFGQQIRIYDVTYRIISNIYYEEDFIFSIYRWVFTVSRGNVPNESIRCDINGIVWMPHVPYTPEFKITECNIMLMQSSGNCYEPLKVLVKTLDHPEVNGIGRITKSDADRILKALGICLEPFDQLIYPNDY